MKQLQKVLAVSAFLIGIPMTVCAQASFSYQAQVDEGLENVIAIAAGDAVIDYGSEDTAAEELRFLFTGKDTGIAAPADTDEETLNAYWQEVHDYSWENFNLGGLLIYKPEGVDMLVYRYEGIATEDVGDYEYADYNSYYDGDEDKQIRYVTYDPEDDLAIYIKFYNYNSDIHDSVHIKWEDGNWYITKFDCDLVENPAQAAMAAKYSFWDYTSYEVTTQTSALNVRETPGGEIIGKLEKGSSITLYRHEEPAEDGMLFSLVGVYSEPDEDGTMYLQYYGWCASQYLSKEADYAWVLTGGEANDRAVEKWSAPEE